MPVTSHQNLSRVRNLLLSIVFSSKISEEQERTTPGNSAPDSSEVSDLDSEGPKINSVDDSTKCVSLREFGNAVQGRLGASLRTEEAAAPSRGARHAALRAAPPTAATTTRSVPPTDDSDCPNDSDPDSLRMEYESERRTQPSRTVHMDGWDESGVRTHTSRATTRRKALPGRLKRLA